VHVHSSDAERADNLRGRPAGPPAKQKGRRVKPAWALPQGEAPNERLAKPRTAARRQVDPLVMRRSSTL
jgi:hypothetical protein